MKKNIIKMAVIGGADQNSVSDAIKSVIEKERNITITEMLEKENTIPYVKVYNYECLIPLTSNKIIFDKPKSKYHK